MPNPMQRRGVALTGGAGLVGSAVLEALSSAGTPASTLTRAPLRRALPGVRSVVAPGGLADDAALGQLVDGAGALVHAASYVGSRGDLQREVNVEGTARLVSAAKRHGVDRIVYLSTATVYGDLPPDGAGEGELPVRPGTALSASRARAERFVLDAGGTVVRPHLVHGECDRWFLGRYVSMSLALGALPGGGTARVSVIDRESLGRLIAAVAQRATTDSVLHASYPFPVRIDALARQVFEHLGVGAPGGAISPGEALEIFKPLGVPESLVRMVTRGGALGSDRIWELTGVAAPPDAVLDSATLDWYVRNVRATSGAMERLVRRRRPAGAGVTVG